MSDRKYRHRGYQDDDREERQPDRSRRAPVERGKPRVEGAPRGRGVGLPGDAVFKCALCGKQAGTLDPIESTSTCSQCGKPLHSCTNCSFFDSGSRFECRKPIPARIESKAKANDCEFYQPKTVRDLRSKTPSSPNDARSAFDALFKK